MHKTYLIARMQLLYIKLSDTVVWRIDRFANTINRRLLSLDICTKSIWLRLRYFVNSRRDI